MQANLARSGGSDGEFKSITKTFSSAWKEITVEELIGAKFVYALAAVQSNTYDGYIQEFTYIADGNICRLRAISGIRVSTFDPDTGTIAFIGTAGSVLWNGEYTFYVQ